jgi:hypothetical protein
METLEGVIRLDIVISEKLLEALEVALRNFSFHAETEVDVMSSLN